MNKGTLYLIPSPLSDAPLTDVLPARLLETVRTLDCFVVEELRTARRFLSAAGLRGHIEELEFHQLNEHTGAEEIEALEALFKDGRNVGLISEAGLPAVADPGAPLVALCHRIGVKVVPLVGPSSLMMALMASGLGGQCFAFEGYLPAKTAERRKALVELEKQSARHCRSEIFIETPYRNDQMFADCIECLQAVTRLCIAINISASDEEITSKTVAEWKKQKPQIGKRPCVFILSASKE